jgi:hypothetical protein
MAAKYAKRPAGVAAGQNKPMASDELFLVTPCPAEAADPANQ